MHAAFEGKYDYNANLMLSYEEYEDANGGSGEFDVYVLLGCMKSFS